MARDPYKYFRVEARELLDQLGQGVLELEKGMPAADVTARLFRVAHTLKGASRVVKQVEIADHAHAIEDVLAQVRDAEGAIARDQIDLLFKLVDEIAARVTALAPAAPVTQPAAAPAEPLTTPPDADDFDALRDGLVESHSQCRAIDANRAALRRCAHLAQLLGAQLGRAPAGDRAPRALADDLHREITAVERALAANLDHLGRELRHAGAAAERLRLVPVATIFTSLERTVRDVAATLGKQVRFAAHGGELRVDGAALSVIQRALLQLVRNAVAHGIEADVQQRLAAGKPAVGEVVVRATRRGNWISFACSDDGRGIDADAVRRAAKRNGMAIDAAGADHATLLRTLLQGGLSTSETITNVSGRGVGLDVLREAAERLGGTATATSEPGRGMTVDLLVPMAIASFQALMIQAAGQTFAIPIDAVKTGVRVVPDSIVRSGQRELVPVNGHAVPLVALSRLLSGAATAPVAAAHSALVIETGAGTAACGVDSILGTAQIVRRPLPALTPSSAAIAGVMLDEAGVPRLVLDPEQLVVAALQAAPGAAAAAPQRRRILVIDDSLTTRMLEQSILESAGYSVEVAASAEEALIIARNARHALYLVDVEMPGMDGFAFIEQVRADAVLRETPAILVTSRNAPADLERGRAVGAQGYIVKGQFDQGVLLEQIRRLAG